MLLRSIKKSVPVIFISQTEVAKQADKLLDRLSILVCVLTEKGVEIVHLIVCVWGEQLAKQLGIKRMPGNKAKAWRGWALSRIARRRSGGAAMVRVVVEMRR
jgi:hypothetical protein